MEQAPLNLTWRQWFFLALLILINVIIFGCLLLAVSEKIYFG